MNIAQLPETSATVITESSIWHIRDGRYRRTARDGRPRPAAPAAGGDLDDDTWVDYREAWLEPHPAVPGTWRLAFIPSHRDAASAGVRSGVIVDASFPPVDGAWQH